MQLSILSSKVVHELLPWQFWNTVDSSSGTWICDIEFRFSSSLAVWILTIDAYLQYRVAKPFWHDSLTEPEHLIMLSVLFQEAVSLVQNITDAEVASRELIKEAYSRGSSDNITCVVVRFDLSWCSSVRDIAEGLSYFQVKYFY